jgi:type IV pilus assembly protein PilV
MKRERGMTLVEALVALVVLSVGLLGVAGLQMSSLRNNHNAHLRSQATALAYDIMDRMRANRVAARAGEYNVALAGTIAGATLAATDVNAWRAALAATLPAGNGAVNLVAGTNQVTITIQWSERVIEGSNENATVQFVTTTQL